MFKIGDRVYVGTEPGRIVDHNPSFDVFCIALDNSHSRVWAGSERLVLALEDLEEPKTRCECGAHITTYPDDHMHFCPLFIKAAQ